MVSTPRPSAVSCTERCSMPRYKALQQILRSSSAGSYPLLTFSIIIISFRLAVRPLFRAWHVPPCTPPPVLIQTQIMITTFLGVPTLTDINTLSREQAETTLFAGTSPPDVATSTSIAISTSTSVVLVTQTHTQTLMHWQAYLSHSVGMADYMVTADVPTPVSTASARPIASSVYFLISHIQLLTSSQAFFLTRHRRHRRRHRPSPHPRHHPLVLDPSAHSTHPRHRARPPDDVVAVRRSVIPVPKSPTAYVQLLLCSPH
jgi:hypothetical protein